MNFVNALEKIPGIIAQYEELTAKLKADVPQLESIIAKTWGKEDELKQLKSELAALDLKITAELAPKHDENDGTENKQEQSQQTQTEVASQTVTPNPSTRSEKPSIVAEPVEKYPQREPISSRIIIGSCGTTTPGGFRARPKI